MKAATIGGTRVKVNRQIRDERIPLLVLPHTLPRNPQLPTSITAYYSIKLKPSTTHLTGAVRRMGSTMGASSRIIMVLV
jgi:hypothetical protein